MRVNYRDLADAVGTESGPSTWIVVTQQRIARFASATEDFQWIHVCPRRAVEGPFGTAIAHGFLTLSLISRFLEELVTVDDTGMTVNYGLNRVRFPAPVPAGSRVRGRVVLADVASVASNARQATWQITIEAENQHRPVCVAEFLTRYYASDSSPLETTSPVTAVHAPLLANIPAERRTEDPVTPLTSEEFVQALHSTVPPFSGSTSRGASRWTR